MGLYTAGETGTTTPRSASCLPAKSAPEPVVNPPPWIHTITGRDPESPGVTTFR